MTDLSRGADEFAALARRLAEAGEGGLQRALYKNINAAVRPATDAVRKGLKDHLPDPYAGVLDASLRFTVTKRETGGIAGVRVIATARGNRGHPRRLPRLESGILGHPVFGMRRGRRWAAWEEQTSHVEPGFFAGPLKDQAPRVRAAVLAAMRETTARITRRI